MHPLISYWKNFEAEFKRELSLVSKEEFSDAWGKRGNRTTFYENRVIPNIAKSMGLKYLKEDFKIDYTLCNEVDGENVPLIFIESENDASTAHHEIRKLCCLSAPLKVLIICAEWSEEKDAWKHGGVRSKLLEKWSRQIRAHNKCWSVPAITGIIVAEWNTSLRFYSLAYDHFGEIVDNEKTIFEC
ncbi:hypothetical protein [Marinomonas communis]|uniref:hypothetical protein n=1 Tax=Marinomonas communis TaxID=28254 RepID=UPI001D185E30|nr:hypothetical protein [Marinomonas communis]MCC4273917.1 hypothetical protein [Marinomonas communis]